MTLAKCQEFIRYCPHCQKNSLRWLTAYRVVIDNRLLNVVMIDLLYQMLIPVGKIKNSRIYQLQIVLVSLLKAAVVIPFKEAVFMSARGTHFMALAKELLNKFVGHIYISNELCS